jgi:hypothetical protein
VEEMILLAVDPSISCSGVAVFVNGKLHRAEAVKVPAKDTLINRIYHMSNAIYETHYAPHLVVLEWPQVYTHGPNDRNDLLGLAGVCGGVASLFAADGTALLTYLPREWVANLKKSKKGDPRKSPRGLYIGRRLDETEQNVWRGVKSHDVVDAIGIGLHHLGRMQRKRVFPGAT